MDSAVAQIRFSAALECRDYFAKVLAKDYSKLVRMEAEGRWPNTEPTVARSTKIEEERLVLDRIRRK